MSSCQQEDIVPDNGTQPPKPEQWLIPSGEVFDGGPGKDGIPAIDNPNFSPVDQINFLAPEDLVLVFKHGDEIKIYPHPILDWHEIINDKIGDKAIAITYCPLTGTGIGWDRVIDGQETTFGVSGLLYNSNLIPYDRDTDSNWSQMGLQCVNGELIGQRPETYQLLETEWETAQTWFPEAQVVNTNTGFSRDYSRYPYGPYREETTLIFPVAEEDERLHPKERVLGIVSSSGHAKIYTFNSFEEMRLVQDIFDSRETLIFGSAEENFLQAYYPPETGMTFSLAPNNSEPETFLVDNEGNEWNIFGEAIRGPRSGEKMETPKAFIGYWFSWAAFYHDPIIFEE